MYSCVEVSLSTCAFKQRLLQSHYLPNKKKSVYMHNGDERGFTLRSAWKYPKPTQTKYIGVGMLKHECILI